MDITLFWRDKKWEASERGYANHIWLHIYPDKKTYKKYISMYEAISDLNVVEVTRKSDIKDMIKYLEFKGYQMED